MTTQPDAGKCRICGFVHYGSCVQALTRALQGALHDLNKARQELHEQGAAAHAPGQAQVELDSPGPGQRESTAGPTRGPAAVPCSGCIERDRAITERDIELQQLRPAPGRFNRAEYQRQYMRSWRAKQAGSKGP